MTDDIVPMLMHDSDIGQEIVIARTTIGKVTLFLLLESHNSDASPVSRNGYIVGMSNDPEDHPIWNQGYDSYQEALEDFQRLEQCARAATGTHPLVLEEEEA